MDRAFLILYSTPLPGKEHRIRIKKSQNDLRIALQNFVFFSFWPETKMEDA